MADTRYMRCIEWAHLASGMRCPNARQRRWISSKVASIRCSLRLGSACWSSLSWAAFLRRRLGASDASLAVDAGGGGGCSRWPGTVTATGSLQGLWPAPLTPTLRTLTCSCMLACKAVPGANGHGLARSLVCTGWHLFTLCCRGQNFCVRLCGAREDGTLVRVMVSRPERGLRSK